MATIPLDPLFSQQWHLRNTTSGLLDLNVVDVWDDYTGAGVQVAIIDDAVQRDHPDLKANYSKYKDWDFKNSDSNPIGTSSESHGTAVAGIIGANKNSIGGVGVAYGSTIFGFRGTTNENIADAIKNAYGGKLTAGRIREADIVNISLGFVKDSKGKPEIFFDKNDKKLDSAINQAVIWGRDGLGTILVKSAGNERKHNSDTNAQSWNANKNTISVAAVNDDGYVASYSTHGASVLVSAFGTPGIVTTDRLGSEGYNTSGDYAYFSRTSAAAPMVSGVVALMLEANPNLGWRDVQEILAYSARHVGTPVSSGINNHEEYAWKFNGADNWNGGGLHFSNDYGFGLVDAKAAVRLAETWGSSPQTSANDVIVSRDLLDVPQTILTGPYGDRFSEFIPNEKNIEIEHVELEVRFREWEDVVDLKIRLESPDGTSSILIDNIGDGQKFAGGRWKFFSNQFRGEDTSGTWKVQLLDKDSNKTSPIRIDDIDLTFYGQPISNDDTFIFTEEYSDYAGWGSSEHTTSINGGTGTDKINAAAVVDSNTTVNLNTGTGSIDGIAITTSGIEDVVTGDGNDWLIGNSLNNSLSGMRGNDYLNGYHGQDTLFGEAGDDTLFGGDDNDYLYGNEAEDILFGQSGNDTLYGGVGNDELEGGLGNDYLSGGLNPDDIDVSSLESRFRAVYDWSINHGYGGALPNFHQFDYNDGRGTVYGTLLLNSEAVQWTDLSQQDFALNESGHDALIGGHGNDTLLGGAGNDNLTGSNPNLNVDNSGSEEYDNLTGGAGADIFVLGDAYEAYYQGDGYATITDFDWSEGEKIYAFGSASNYSFDHGNWLGDSSIDTAIYYNNDLIAVLQDAYTSQDYIDEDFIFIFV